MKIDKTHDACGKGCPMLMIELNKAINGMSAGQVLAFICNDQMSDMDIPLWCKRTDNKLLEMTKTDGVFWYHIIKGEGRREAPRKRDFSRY